MLSTMTLSESAKQRVQVLLDVAINLIGVISANFKGFGTSSVLSELFIHLHRT